MCSSPQQDVHVHLACGNEQGISIPRWDDRVAMSETNPQATVCHDFGEREVGRIDIEVPLDQLQVGSDLTEELEGIAICQITQTEYLADFTWR